MLLPSPATNAPCAPILAQDIEVDQESHKPGGFSPRHTKTTVFAQMLSDASTSQKPSRTRANPCAAMCGVLEGKGDQEADTDVAECDDEIQEQIANANGFPITLPL